ncbi:hypothetical protein INS49_000908 [Diaporthe citri]|uniref:uncharacterized protein n=1 Tax=Diaporthe citri TaxID=83186 RepID=UPI001C7FD745|nr:uncharacterized protein INS49_000908 [Diaporthe citri]KAG6366728.1 hypothetical protein INS49_000908 [Diaporthe citri]
MAASPKNKRDKAWLGWFIMQLIVIFLIDAVQFYPPELYKAPGSPLYFLQQMKDFYISTYNDPLVQSATAPNWMHLVSVVEIGFQLPVALYAVWRLSGSRGTSGPFELLLLAYAFETAFSTLLCINDVFYWDPAVYSWEQKKVFLFQLYGSWLVIPTVMFVDMYWRLYSRLSATDAVKKTQ